MKKLKSIPVTLIAFMALTVMMASCTGSTSNHEKSGNMDWKLFRGNAGLSGYSSQQLPENPVLLWSYNGGARTVSSPVIDNGTTYWCDKRGLIKGVDLSGKLTFEYKLNTAVEATPMIHDSILYIGRIDGKMTALSLASKDTIWNYETMGQISASPNLGDFQQQQVIVFGSYDNNFYCIDSHSGKAINQFESGYYINGAAVLWKSSVLFGGCDSWLRVIDCQTGMPTDSLMLDAYIPASPAVMGNFCYVSDYTGNIYEIELENGKISRSRKMVTASSDNGSMVSVPALDPENLYYLADEQYLCSVDRRKGTQNWKFLLKGNTGESSPLVCNDKIIVCTKSGIISIHESATGNQLWEYDTGEQIVGSPAVIDGHFMILTAKGTLFCFGEKN
ncbi:PQQ-binding-like beta-propeller repeat protein [Mangrovibacterium marinum]|uniref:outer membrane protein assembly factor BamB family protein n=1 Tax=Mangrovibacterium marinum TaxID=1639118 RepID=UPI001B879D98|nr:PQQ-binding-like beta-propeller repeat protein [Mangrovibacterium marinum]